MILRAAFFDRDNTLLHMDPALRAARTAKIEGWTGRPYHQTYEEMMELFRRAGYPEEGLKSVQEEICFWRRYYRELLEEEGVTDCLEERAEELWDMTWLKGYQLFPETREVLDWFRSRGVRMGVISDTSPSLPLTLEAAGIGEYFGCAVCSDLVGAMKPDPAIYRAALATLGVPAEESLYVDDYDVEAAGARTLGFTAFHIDRSQPGDGAWRIQSLLKIVEFVKKYT
ncbi:MAG: HAD-IA family hydrolase [Oscillospiraceae bacterium]|jgi:putative hydrolase of the HAD superfamily|nr:HAD-IA family hydrolase [Oscillospiraceae bacterium]